ncbi:MAG: NAD(+)/NADH kinase [Candidatus Omnitrophica bacterium]|nr:NAD(+)/NADH kinase [Candidatus Omnitrophota bacterium]
MSKKAKRILVVYKKSAYKIYFLERKNALKQGRHSLLKEEKKKLYQAHKEHYSMLDFIHKTLKDENIIFKEAYRGIRRDYTPYDTIISVGGDGTFLECARNVKNQLIIGVNSAPEFSVGRLCPIMKKDFPAVIKKVKAGKHKEVLLQRLKVEISGQQINALNDVLMCHSSPAGLSRYYLFIGNKKEEQRSSGLWISSATGSSGGIYSAGGKILDPYSKKLQYCPRELYAGWAHRYKLKGGVLTPKTKIAVLSMIRKGKVYIDGAHVELPFEYGTMLNVSLSANPLRNVVA